MSKFLLITSLLIFFKLPLFSFESCITGSQNCEKCNPLTDLCIKCTKNIYTPDENGGCIPSNHCTSKENYCNECTSKEDLCLICEIGYYPDKNGGCSSTDNCEISFKGECLKCNDDFTLIGDSFKLCKYLYSDDLLNCKEIDEYTGLCSKCNDGFYLTTNNKKCIDSTDYCVDSSFGICTQCIWRYYLDKKDDKCKYITDNFINCKLTIDGINCDECNEGYYLAQDGFCVNTNYCSKTVLETTGERSCKKCEKGYFLTYNGKICTNEHSCSIGDSELGVCNVCFEGYYLDKKSGKCISNLENYKNCLEVDKNDFCSKCEINYELTQNLECVNTKNCISSENGICIQCEENYHLGLDNKCTNVEHCIYSRFFDSNCLECEDGYYYDYYNKKCKEENEEIKNCKSIGYIGYQCEECKNGYYLSLKDYLCYSNLNDGPSYKCAKMDSNETYCISCEKEYFLGNIDKKCSKIEGCLQSTDENNCLECDENYCLDVSNNKCFYNYEPKDKSIYYLCNKTNDEGSACVECANEYTEVKNGVCVNNVECEIENDGECVKCNEKSHDNFNMCVNKLYGCVETILENCLRCDNELNFDSCIECEEGYELNEYNECIEK